MQKIRICSLCGGENDYSQGTWCRACRSKRDKENREYAKRIGLCTHCKKRKAVPGRSMCEKCAEHSRSYKYKANKDRKHYLGKMVTIGGVTRNIRSWCEETGISPALYYKRVQNGWNQSEALTTPRGKAVG